MLAQVHRISSDRRGRLLTGRVGHLGLLGAGCRCCRCCCRHCRCCCRCCRLRCLDVVDDALHALSALRRRLGLRGRECRRVQRSRARRAALEAGLRLRLLRLRLRCRRGAGSGGLSTHSGDNRGCRRGGHGECECGCDCGCAMRWVRQRVAGRVRTVRKERAMAMRVRHCRARRHTPGDSRALSAHRSLHFGVAAGSHTKCKEKKKRNKTSSKTNIKRISISKHRKRCQTYSFR